MTSKHNIIGTNNNCISHDTLIAYLKGSLNSKEMHKVERHLQSCPMCSDELEGLGLLSHPEDIEKISDKLNDKVDNLLASKSNRFRLGSAFNIAASVTLLIAVSGLIYLTPTLKSPGNKLAEATQPVIMNDSVFYDYDIGIPIDEKVILEEEPARLSDKVIKPETELLGGETKKDEVVVIDWDDKEFHESVSAEIFAEVKNEKAAAQPKPSAAAIPEMVMAGEESNKEPNRLMAARGVTAERASQKMVNQLDEEDTEEEEIFTIVETMPLFIYEGKLSEFRQYIKKNLRYPQQAAENAIQGKVIVNFVVDTDGSVIKVKVVKGIDPLLDAEALRVIKSSPKWKPGTQRGKPVQVKFSFPVVFSLDGGN